MELGLNSSRRVKVVEVEEGSEPEEFVKALGPQDKKAYDCMLQGQATRTASWFAAARKASQMRVCVIFTDPGKYNYTPRLFRLSAKSGLFGGEELLYPARVMEGVMAMPFLQENLYSVQQPGKHREESLKWRNTSNITAAFFKLLCLFLLFLNLTTTMFHLFKQNKDY